MQICIPNPLARERPVSIIETKNKFRLGHDEACNCCCCCMPQPTCYKYVQPKVPKSFKPLRYYWKPDIPIDDNTTYKLSYWEGPPSYVEPIRPRDGLKLGEGPISDETTHKASYLGNWCVKPEPSITPCERQLLGRGPMQDVTTQKHDYTWKFLKPPEPIKERPNLYNACAAMSDDTTYRLSYFPSGNCYLPISSFAPIRKYERSNVPMEGCTTYKLSYWPNEAKPPEEQPWNAKRAYHPPAEPMDACTTYRLSYWPNDQEPPKPIIQPETDNILNAKCCFDENTTYRLSYYGCGGDPSDPIVPPGQLTFSTCPLSHDTTNRLSYLGNWCFEPEKSIIPCSRQLLGRGPIQDVTTQKHDFTWKRTAPPDEIRPRDNIFPSPCPLEDCTTHKLSYIPNYDSVLPIASFAPIRTYNPSNVPLESETTMKLSYQPVEPDTVEKPWAYPAPYHPPATPMEDNTTYNLSFIPPGTLVPLSCPCPPANSCDAAPAVSCSAS